MPGTELFTIGHSNHPLERFVELLTEHGIEALVDIRRFPSSRKFPHFNRENLASALNECGIEYHWFEALGGRRQSNKGEPSPNMGMKNESFRNYADYMLTDEFRTAVDRLLEIAEGKRTAMMCAESLFWRCHRRLVSDFLLAGGVTVQHIFPNGATKPHELTNEAKVEDGALTYPAREEQPTFDW